jgi:hypothetical protein
MKFEKKHINRAVSELAECISNILNAEREQYALRIRQLFQAIRSNTILDFIITPYVDLVLDESKVGFIETGHHMKHDFIIPENEDEEIALILKVLFFFGEHEEAIDGSTVSIYMKNSYDENLYLFNKNIAEPAFKKLLRKIQYKIEDIGIVHCANKYQVFHRIVR